MGRGLSALMGSPAAPPVEKPEPQAPAAPAPAGPVEVPIDHIVPNPHQPRHEFATDALQELADSIREHGIIQPLVVRQVPADARAGRDATPRYQIIAGERRWRAAQRAGLTEVPVVVKEASPEAMLELALVENIQRADLNPLEEASAYKELGDRFGLTQQQVAQRVGRSRSHVANTIRLLNLPEPIIAALFDGRITAGHAILLLQLDGPAQVRMMEETLAEGYSVRQLEELVRRLKDMMTDAPPDGYSTAQLEEWFRRLREPSDGTAMPDSEPPEPETGATSRRPPARRAFHDANTADLERRFSQSLNQRGLSARVQLTRSSRGGKLVISWASEEELDNLYRALVGGDEDE
jgi:ParB family chromosome partitioning protein